MPGNSAGRSYVLAMARCVRDAGAAFRLNSQVVEGSFFLQEERLIFRTSARLTERFEAQARIAAALEYNAAVLSHWWERLAAGAQGSPFPLESRRSSAVPLDDTL